MAGEDTSAALEGITTTQVPHRPAGGVRGTPPGSPGGSAGGVRGTPRGSPGGSAGGVRGTPRGSPGGSAGGVRGTPRGSPGGSAGGVRGTPRGSPGGSGWAIVRSRDNRILLGVAGGLGERLGVDPILVRIAFAVLAIAGGSGVLLYLLAWGLSVEPEAATVAAGPVRRPNGRQALALGMVVLGTMLLLRQVGLWFGDRIAWPVALAAAGSAVIWARSDDRDRARWTRAGARIPGNPV